MNLIEESYIEKQEKPKKVMKIIIVLMVLLMLAIFIIVGVLFSIREKPLSATIDGQPNNQFTQLVISKKEEQYVSIRQLAPLLNYDVFKGEYKMPSESESKCYVTYKDGNEAIEAVDMVLGEKTIYKRDISKDSSSSYETAELQYPVEGINGDLCINVKDIQQVFNTIYEFDNENNAYHLYTLPYLVEQYTQTAIDLGYEIEDTYPNQKLIFNNMLPVKSAGTNSVGIIDLKEEGKQLIEVKYETIKYMPETGDCIVSDNKGKYGVVSPTGSKKTKIDVMYDSIDFINKETGLYVVKQSAGYGIVDSNGEIKVPVEYDAIGIDITKFSENDISNKYLLVNNLIPVKKDEKWALSDKNGKKLTEFEYDGFGYTARSNKSAINLIEIPQYELIVVKQNDKYGFINKYGKVIEDYGIVFDDIYMLLDAGEYIYRAMYNGKEYDVKKLLDDIDIKNQNSVNPSTSTDSQSQNQQPVEEQQPTDPNQQPVEYQQPVDPNQLNQEDQQTQQ